MASAIQALCAEVEERGAVEAHFNSAIELQFVSEAGLSSWAIGWFSAGDAKTRVSHVDAVMPDGSLLGARYACDGAISSKKGGVQLRHPEYAAFTRRVHVTLPCTSAERDAFSRFIFDQLGKPYDWKCIAGFFSGRDWREDDSWICSELIARALEVAHIVPTLYLGANRITPVALLLLLSAIGARIEELPTVLPRSPLSAPMPPVTPPKAAAAAAA